MGGVFCVAIYKNELGGKKKNHASKKRVWKMRPKGHLFGVLKYANLVDKNWNAFKGH
jgi:hypothetical protein